MPEFLVSKAAQNDLREIVRYTTKQWGAERARKYAAVLRSSFQKLVESPEMGRTCEWIRPGLRRHEVARHVVFYCVVPAGVHVVRVLHQQMIPSAPRLSESPETR